MEFLLFLNTNEKEILSLIYKANFSVEENTPLCLLGENFFGFLKRKQKRVVICTKNAMNIGGYWIPKGIRDNDYDATGAIVRRALRHEAVHVAQSCNKGNLLNIDQGRNLKLHPYKVEALRGSIKISQGSKAREYEAYLIEDKPKLVITALKKYCL